MSYSRNQLLYLGLVAGVVAFCANLIRLSNETVETDVAAESSAHFESGDQTIRVCIVANTTRIEICVTETAAYGSPPSASGAESTR